MPDVNEVVERLRDERSRLATGDVDAGLRRVERLAEGRRRRHRLAAGAGMLGAVAAIAALAVIVESPTPDIVVTDTTPDDTAPAQTVPESTDADSPSTSVAPTSPTTAPTTTAGTSDTVETPSMPSLGDTVAGRTATGAFVPVTDQLRTAAGEHLDRFRRHVGRRLRGGRVRIGVLVERRHHLEPDDARAAPVGPHLG